MACIPITTEGPNTVFVALLVVFFVIFIVMGVICLGLVAYCCSRRTPVQPAVIGPPPAYYVGQGQPAVVYPPGGIGNQWIRNTARPSRRRFSQSRRSGSPQPTAAVAATSPAPPPTPEKSV